jgi:hypothetical protein
MGSERTCVTRQDWLLHSDYHKTFTHREKDCCMDRIVQSYCLDCEWSARADMVADRNEAVVEHALTTGHDIDSALIHPTIDPPKRPELN